MELDFDKEIDTLLRKARPAKGVLAGDAKLPHLDADGIAAFAENALPQKSRQAYVAHFADCSRCREILSDTILMNSEVAPETAFAAAPVIVAAAEPWYRKLFLFPNVAYAMGTLVLMFGGMLGYLVLQEADGGLSSEVSQIEEDRPTASGPDAGEESVYPSAMSSNANMSAANTMSSAANTMAKASVTNLANSASASSNSTSLPVVTGRALDAPSGEVLAERDKDVSVTSADSALSQLPAPPPPSAPAARERPEQRKEDAAAGAGKNEIREAEESKLSAKKKDQMSRMDGGPFKSAGPQRNQQRSFPNQVQNNEFEAAVTRAVGGKKFQRREGIWYDSAYRGQGTTNVRRGTEQYRKLDGALRSIAENLDGAVVTVWKDKAYRIQ